MDPTGKVGSEQKHFDDHHAYPRSRIPRKYRSGKQKILGKWLVIKKVSIVAHRSFHAIFGNRTPEEQLEFLRQLCNDGNILNQDVYRIYRQIFDAVFGMANSYIAMRQSLKKWDLSYATRKKYADRLTKLYMILNKKISGGISLKRFAQN